MNSHPNGLKTMQYTVKVRVKIVEAHFELKSVTQTQQRFVIEIPGRNTHNQTSSAEIQRKTMCDQCK